MNIKKVLSIAGSDCSGGAGIQADMKTMTVSGCYAMSVITALTAQNTTGVYGVSDVDPEFVGKQIDCVFEDIRPDAVKIGMVSNREIISIIAERLLFYKAEKIVVDPVMVATSGGSLLADGTVNTLIEKLFPIASVITPNLPEASVLCGLKIESISDMEKAARFLTGMTNGAVIIKGGHLTDSADDLLAYENGLIWYKAPRIDTKNSHGTGCTLSSAIACELAKGKDIPEAFRIAKDFISNALSTQMDLGAGNGPLNHLFKMNK